MNSPSKKLLLFLFSVLFSISCSSSGNTASSDSEEKEKVTIEISEKGYRMNPEDTTYTHPKIKGGIQKLQEKVKYPKEAKERNIQGIVRLGIYVEKDGSVNEITILNSSHPILNRAAKKAVQKSEFIPGTMNGKPVRVYMTFPVRFRL